VRRRDGGRKRGKTRERGPLELYWAAIISKYIYRSSTLLELCAGLGRRGRGREIGEGREGKGTRGSISCVSSGIIKSMMIVGMML
jgi:hypothetical protein